MQKVQPAVLSIPANGWSLKHFHKLVMTSTAYRQSLRRIPTDDVDSDNRRLAGMSLRRLDGLEDPRTQEFGSRCLIARRLIERGVRFVQIFTENQRWDHHGSIFSKLASACKKVDVSSAALAKDLKQRGLLDSTVVHWGGEMGRLPVIQNDTGPKKIGSDQPGQASRSSRPARYLPHSFH